jgi:hypothetical protein
MTNSPICTFVTSAEDLGGGTVIIRVGMKTWRFIRTRAISMDTPSSAPGPPATVGDFSFCASKNTAVGTNARNIKAMVEEQQDERQSV